MNTRDIIVKTRVNAEEKEKIEILADKRGMSVSTLLRVLLFEAMKEENLK